jgi:hypothetical protein
MMKLEFNNEGFFALQHQLYQLNDEHLKDETDIIRHNFTVWLSHHFDINQRQLAFMEALDQDQLKVIAMDTGFAIENRMPISLNPSDCYPNGFAIIQQPNMMVQLSFYQRETLQLNINISQMELM